MYCEPNKFSRHLRVGFSLGMRRYLRMIDEMQRLMHLEALFFQFGATAILVMAYAALARAGVLPELTAAEVASYVWIGSFLLWGVGLLLVRRKYE
jgi:vacuolar-type H+-ATPase subunit I/STV1